MENEQNDLYVLLLSKSENYCALEERCESSVRIKLFEWGADSLMSDRIVTHLVEAGFIDEKRYAIAFSRSKARFQRWGRRKIISHLKQKGIPDDVVRYAIGELDCEEYDSALLSLARRKWQSLAAFEKRKRWEKVVSYLMSRGYDASEVFGVVKKVMEAESED